jgi:predicted dehydrogenase
MRVGLVGLGDAGRHHARSLLALDRKGALLWTAICARDAGRIEQARADLGAPEHARAYAGLDDLLAAGACDALILATPDRKEPRALPFEQLDPYRAELADFIAKAEAGATESARDTLANLSIMDAIDRARGVPPADHPAVAPA